MTASENIQPNLGLRRFNLRLFSFIFLPMSGAGIVWFEKKSHPLRYSLLECHP